MQGVAIVRISVVIRRGRLIVHRLYLLHLQFLLLQSKQKLFFGPDFPYTVILPFPTDISLGSEFLPVFVFGPGWGWVRSEVLKEAKPAPVDRTVTSFLCP